MVPHNFLSNFYPVACINVGDQQPDRFRMRHGSGTRRIFRPDGRMNGHREPTGNVPFVHRKKEVDGQRDLYAEEIRL
jgi:hypothetical protein